jgi:hypothetical protein
MNPTTLLTLTLALMISVVHAQKATPAPKTAVSYPPTLAEGQEIVTDRSPDFLMPVGPLAEGVTVAQTPPTIDFLYYPGQNYPGNPWSVWGQGSALAGKYYSSIGDHLAPAGNAFVYEYDAGTKKLRRLMETRGLLAPPDGHYAPGKIHSRLDLGADGWLYFSTHRGSTRVTTDQYHYKGDWVLRCHPVTGAAEIVMHAPVPKHCIPTSMLDPERLIFYGGTAPGTGGDENGIQFFACDVRAKKLIYSGGDGPARCIAFAKSTGRVYFTPSKGETLMRFDPAKGGAPEPIAATLPMRAASAETPQGVIYAVSSGGEGKGAQLSAFHTRTERVEPLGPAGVGSQQYITSLEADSTGRYLYYIPGAHGGADRDGTPVVQFDTQTRQRKVIAFLHPFYQTKYGCALKGTYSAVLDPRGDKLYVTWNANRGSRAWDTCALTVIHIPASERAGL